MNARSVALKGAVAAFCLLASACTNPNAFETNYAEPIGSAPVLNNPTPYTDALYCMGEHFTGEEAPVPHVISVGKILDYTGKDDIETGRRLTQGAALMAMSALGKAGVPQVERFDTSVTELEIKFADNQLIGDEEQGGVRRLIAGEIPGSGYHLIGGITELNYNIRSNEGEVLYDIVSFGARYYVMNIGLDLRLIHTKSLRVIETVSYQKQIIGARAARWSLRILRRQAARSRPRRTLARADPARRALGGRTCRVRADARTQSPAGRRLCRSSLRTRSASGRQRGKG